MTHSPLQGIRVIEFCNVAAGPYCGMLLADMGADVVKVEHPVGGDTLRSWPPISPEGFSENFASLNRNKQSVTLDLKNETDLQRARKLIEEADVLLENNRPGAMERLGLGFNAVREINPQLVYCSISAYGQEGPRSSEGGFDLTIQAMSGVMSVTGEPDRPPVKCGVPVSDFTAGLYGAFAIASALHEARRGGEGVHIDVSMLGTSLAIAALQTSEYFGNGRDPVRLGSAHPRNAPYQAFRCKDGYFAMAAGNNGLWAAVCKLVQKEHWTNDERFTTTALRAQNQGVLCEMLEDIFVLQDRDHWLTQLRAFSIPCAPINSFSQALADEQVQHMKWVQPLQLPGGTQTQTFASPLRFNGEMSPIRLNPPELGQHNDILLQCMPLEAGHENG